MTRLKEIRYAGDISQVEGICWEAGEAGDFFGTEGLPPRTHGGLVISSCYKMTR